MPLLARRLLSLLCVLLAGGTLSAQTTFSTVVVFGDSLSDTGNIAHLTESHYGVRYPADNQLLGFDYTDGRFTDGPDTQPAAQAYFGVWIEQLAASFAAKPAVKDSLDGGTNYAYGDATTGAGTTTESKTFAGVPVSITLNNMGQQVSDYLATSPTPNAQTLYALWGGANDVLNAAIAGQDPIAAATVAAQNELGLIQQLMAAGATNFIIPNLPPLGGIPEYAGTPTSTALNDASYVFAQTLAAGLTTLKQGAMGAPLNFYQVDIFTLFQTLAADPMAVGLSNVTGAAQNITGSPDTYLIWDGEHPTTTGHHFVAATAANLLTPLVASSITLPVPPAVLLMQTATVTATVSSTGSSVKPTGLVTLFEGTLEIGSAALDATGTATIMVPGTIVGPPGTYNISAVYAGDTTYNVSVSATTPVTVLASAIGTTTTVSSSSLNADLNASVTFTATVAPAVSTYGAPGGTVTFYDGSTSLGTGTLTNGTATFTTSSLTAGTHSITASYGAAGVFGGSTSGAISEVVTAPGFTVTASPTSLTLPAGGSGTVSFTAVGSGGFTGSLTAACGTLPTHFSCSFSSTTLPVATDPSSTTAVVLTIKTNAPTASALYLPERPGLWTAPRIVSATLVFPALSGLFFLGLRRRRSSFAAVRLTILLLLLGAGAVFGVAGCGSSTNNDAKAGSYTVPVTFTPATGSAQTVNIAVTVQ